MKEISYETTAEKNYSPNMRILYGNENELSISSSHYVLLKTIRGAHGF